jgi:hypothetical protein
MSEGLDRIYSTLTDPSVLDLSAMVVAAILNVLTISTPIFQSSLRD